MTKKTTLLLSLFFASTTQAQPVLVNTMPPTPVGTTDSIYTATASIAPGAGGPGITWNLSALSPVAQGTAAIVTPSSTPYFTTFPTTTFCAKISLIGGSTIYVYQRFSSAKFETLANNYAGPGTGQDYSPNPESELEFPMNYLDAFVDTFQTTVGGPGTVAITYDGYGTLITPFATYTNVARIYKYWGAGDYDYDWVATSPNIGIVASYHAQSNSYTLVRPSATTDVNNLSTRENVTLYPNPVLDEAIIKIEATGGIDNAFMLIMDACGKTVKQIPVDKDETRIRKDGLHSGIYFYQVCNGGQRVANGKLVIQ